MRKIFFYIVAIFSLLLNPVTIFAAPPAEQYRFQDNQTIFGIGGEYAEQVIFRSDRPFQQGSAPEYRTSAASTVGGDRQPRLATCYLPPMKLTQFNNEATQAKLVIDGTDKSGRPCDKKLIDKFIDQNVKIDNSLISDNTAPPGGDLIPQRISVRVIVGTTAKGNQTVPKEFQSDEITIDGPTNISQYIRRSPQKLMANFSLNRTSQDDKANYSLEFLGISDAINVEGPYTACSKVAQKCVDFEKKSTMRANVEIENKSVVIEGVDTNKDGEIAKKVPPAPPPPCKEGKVVNNQCTEFESGFGALSTNAGGFISSVFGILLSGAGAIALILIMRAGFKIMTSEGNPEKVKEGRDQLIAAIVGLIFLIFSLVFLQLIGVDLLKIKGFEGSASSTKPEESSLNLPGIQPNPQAGCTEKLFKPGDRHICVEGIQRILGVSPVDGFYNSDTENAVIKLQRKKGVYVDGIVGPCTWGAIMEEPIDPICSQPLTPDNVRKFQNEKGLKVDGTINKCTFEALIGSPIPNSCKK